jgi:hypothetical protein
MKNFIEKKLQRKFQANCKIVGDPSIITSKVYGFFGLRDFDNGKWYCVSCEHIINPNQGYVTTMELIKKPQVISTVYERRENNFEGEQQAAPEYKQDDLFFTDDNGNAFNYTGPDEGDISQRIASQEASEKFYQNDNDIYFQSKSEIDNLKPVINSNYV